MKFSDVYVEEKEEYQLPVIKSKNDKKFFH